MKPEEIVDFVLKFHNCNREYEIHQVPYNALEMQKKLRETFGNMAQHLDSFQEEHDIPENDLERRELYRKTLPVESIIGIVDGKPKFNIIIFPSFRELPRDEQSRMLIHEARHIVDYPTIAKPNEALDLALLKEFWRQKKE